LCGAHYFELEAPVPSLLKPADVQSEMNVTPFIDVLLVLLVIFLLINLLRIRLVQDVQLPPPASATQRTDPQIVLELLPRAGLSVNQQRVPLESLPTYLRTVYEGRPSKLLFVKADSGRRYQDIIDAIDMARAAGVERIAFVPGVTR
jgi:biopolymer transport protein TolR